MSPIVPAPSGRALTNLDKICCLAWVSFLELLKEEIFLRAVEDTVNNPRDMSGLRESEEYYREAWPLICRDVGDSYNAIVERRQRHQMEESLRAAQDQAHGNIAEMLASSFGLETDQDIRRVKAWVSNHPIPAAREFPKEAQEHYADLCACARVEHYRYGESFQRALTSRVGWLPPSFNIVWFLERAQVGWNKFAFLYMWTVFGSEIKADHEMMRSRRRSANQPLASVEADARAVLDVYLREGQRGKGPSERALVDEEYGLLLAAVRAEIARRVAREGLELQNFVAYKHVPEIARHLLEQEVLADGLTAREDSRFFCEEAQRVCHWCNQLLKGTLPWREAIDDRIKRQLADGSIETWEVLLQLEKNGERWRRAFEKP